MSLIDERIEYEEQSNSSPLVRKIKAPQDLDTANTFKIKIKDPCDVEIQPFDDHINK